MPRSEDVHSRGSLRERLTADRISWVVLSLALVLGLVVAGDHGVTTDETLRMRAADGWAKAIARGTVRDWATGTNAHYGVLFDQLGRFVWIVHRDWLGGSDEFAARHLLCFVTGWSGAVGTWALARRLGPAWMAPLAVALVFLAPRYWGSSFANPKDIPFASTWVWAMWACVRAIQSPSRRSTLWVALTAGLCATVRPIGVVFFFVGALSIVAPIVPGGFAGRGLVWRRAAREVALAVCLAFVLVLATWPVSWVHPPWHLLTAAVELTRHPFGSRSLFMGEVYPYDDAPALYAAVWIAITLPTVTLVAAAGGALTRLGRVVRALRSRARPETWLPWLLVLGWAIGPLLVPALRRTTLYDTSRQLTFVVPAMAILASDGIVRAFAALNDRWMRLLLAGVLTVAALDVAVRMQRLHPYASLFFNRAVGGLRGAQGRFDVAHYSETFAEGFSWLREHAGAGARVHVLGNGSTTASYYSWKHDTRLNTTTFAYFLAEVRQGWEDILPGEIVHTIEREGTPLLVIKRVDPIDPMRVAWSWRRSEPAGALPRPPPSSHWDALDVRDGEVVLSERMQPGEPLMLATPIVVETPVRVRLYLRYYHGLRVWLHERLVWDAEAVPFQFRGSHRFPSLVPLDLELEPGTHWLHAELDRVFVPWGIGIYMLRSTYVELPVDPPRGSIHNEPD